MKHLSTIFLLVCLGCGNIPTPDPMDEIRRVMERLQGQRRETVEQTLGRPTTEQILEDVRETVLTYEFSDADVELIMNYADILKSYLIKEKR